MIFGNSLNNIWRNVRHVNDLAQQIETKKLLQRPSDDPIRAARSMRYRTILAETEMFLNNANSSMAWMDSTEAAFMNLLYEGDASLQEINRRLVAASSGTHELSDRLAMVKEMREFFDQIAFEMNQTYMGRYVFSGFYTNQPPILNADMQNRSFVVIQQLQANHIQTVRSFQNLPPDDRQPEVNTVNILNLPYRGLDVGSLRVVDDNGVPVFHFVEKTIFDEDAYQVPSTVGAMNQISPFEPPDSTTPNPLYDPTPVIHFISSTGELVMHNTTKENFPRNIDIEYRVDNPQKGDLNPIVYFNTREVEWDAAFDNGDTTFGNWVNKQPETTHSYNSADHEIRKEIAPSNHIPINSLAREVFTPAMYADLLSLFEFVENLPVSDQRAVESYFKDMGYTGQNLTDAVNKFMSDEQARVQDVLHTRFYNMLGVFSQHKDIVQREHTSLGSRMNRVEMLTIRLEEEEINYTALLSANEDTPLQEAIMRKAAGEAAFAAALRANAMVVQLSLVNFLR
jgi:flagellin-like hook-associated protein FlgL